MIDILVSFAVGVFLGLSVAAPPGAVNAIIATHVATRKRWLVGTFVGFGAMTADAIFLVITYSLGTAIEPADSVLIAIYALGAVVMFFFAYQASKSWSKPPLEEVEKARPAHSYLTGLTVGLTNPYQILWWLTAGLAFIKSIGALMVIGFFVGILIWIVSFPFALDYARKKVEKAYKVILLFALITLIVLGVWLSAQVLIIALGL